jgi:diguanylate cyclase (GGDEF)-like protein
MAGTGRHGSVNLRRRQGFPGGGGFFGGMNPFLSVRFRLFALCTGLLLVLSAANVVLGRINSGHEAQVLQQQEQYRRVSVIYAVQHALAAYRYALGQVNSAGLVKNDDAEARARVQLQESTVSVGQQLARLADFDSDTAARVKDAVSRLPEVLAQGVTALAGHSPEAERHLNEARAVLLGMDEALNGAAQRETALAAEVQRIARERAALGQKVSLAIIVASFLVGLLLTAVVLNSIIRPMQKTVRALRLVNAGETAIDMPPVSQDEFGDMAVALRQFRDQAERLRRLAFRDALTGVGNRARLEESLREGIEFAAQGGTRLALFFINDSLGHAAGDRCLCEVVSRLQRFAPDDALICRYGGDKFAVVLDRMPAWDAETTHQHLLTIANTVLGGMAEPFQLGNDLLPMSVSIGIAVYPADGQGVEHLISGAEAAMYLAKRHGRNNARFASPELTSDARRQLALVTELRRGIEQGEFEPYYQPVVDVNSGRAVGAEALLRWRHPERGVVAASEFVPVAEASGLIHALGEHCMIRAARQAARWSSGPEPIRVSVNLSARQIEDGSAISLVERLHASEPGIRALDFEITETAILQQIDQAQETLSRIQRLGHRLGVDDFGTGYSSMVYLQRFPVNRIKIDRSFVARVESREAQAIIAATVALGRSLDLEVVAEGVESAAQVARLRELGCHLQQGYFFTRPLPAAEFEGWRSRTAARVGEAAAAPA